jgi:hypothetical protein
MRGRELAPATARSNLLQTKDHSLRMPKPTEREILEKWSHIAMRLFPPQMEIAPAQDVREPAIRVRWKKELPSGTHGARGVDLHFPVEMLAAYREADAEVQVKWDALIEAAISERLRTLDAANGRGNNEGIGRWLISPARPAP